MVLEFGKSKIKALVDLVSGEGLLLGSHLTMSSQGGISLEVSLVRAPIHSPGLRPHDLVHLPEAPPPYTITLEIGSQCKIWEGGYTFRL